MAAAIADGTLGGSPVVGHITTAVHNLHPALAWELGPGRAARHNLTVTPEGDMALRRLTAQWHASAPPPDETWEYHPCRQRTEPLLGLEIQGVRFSPEEFRVAFAFDDTRERFDVTLHHPVFKDADAGIVHHALFLTVDEALGEDDVERWIGALEPAAAAPSGAVGISEFVAAVDRARGVATGERFSLAQGQARDGKPVILMVNMALKQIDHLDHVFHLTVVVPLRDADRNGLTTNTEAQGLNAAEDALLGTLGDNAIQLGRVTWGGRREMHFYVRDPAAADAATRAWEASSAPWKPSHTMTFDPRWNASREGIYSMLAPRRG